MKIHCNNIDTIPDTEEIIDLTQQEHLVLEFPKDKINPKIESDIISELKRELPENYSVFNSGIWDSTITITIKSVVSENAINQNFEFIKQGIKDYLDVSNMLLNDTQSNELEDWELTDEHGEYNRYENLKTGQILETCSYRITNFENIDPYFWGLFIKTSANHPELKEMIKSEFHDSCRILDFIQKNEELKKQIIK